jgi:hypothetical protein
MENKHVDEVVRNYQQFLFSSWPTIEKVFKAIEDTVEIDYYYDDWFQANWELIVESVLCKPGEEFLEAYGEGADCNGMSDRVCFPEAISTHEVRCTTKNGEKLKDLLKGESLEISKLVFLKFVSWDGKHYNVTAPFDHVLLEDIAIKIELKRGGFIHPSFIFPLDEIIFEILPLKTKEY